MKPCEYRTALEDGRIICEKITEGNPEVNPNICRHCPMTAINCQHLRFTLCKVGHKPILVRYGNGATEVWDDNPPGVELVRGACAEKVMPVTGARDCVGCRVRSPAHEVPARERQPVESATVVASVGNVIQFPTAAPRQVNGEQPTSPSKESSHSSPAGRTAQAR